MITLENNKGQQVKVPANATLEDLIKMGVDRISLVKKGEPLPDGWFKANDEVEHE